MVRLAVAGSALVVLLSGCSLFPSARDQAHDQLQERLDGMHEGVLQWRAGDPTLSGEAAVRRFDTALHTTVDGDSFSVVLPIVARVETGGGLFYEQVSVGACVLVHVQVGTEDGDRGEVVTAPVPCPEGVAIEEGNERADELVTDLDGHRSDVPEPEPHFEPCISGEVCDHGGG